MKFVIATILLFLHLALGLTVLPVSARTPEDGIRPMGYKFMDLKNPEKRSASTGAVAAFGAAQPGTTYFGGTYWAADSMRWEALMDSVWTFNSGVGSSFESGIPGVDPFKLPGLHTLMEGWIGKDFTRSDEGEFRRLSVSDFTGPDVCVGDPAFGEGIGGNYSFWAGLLPGEADQKCYALGQGYGNNWNICIGQVFSYNGSGSIILEYDFVNETEGGPWDFTKVYVDTSGIADGSDDVELVNYGGVQSGHDSFSLVPGLNLMSSAGDIRISFCFTSDVAWSDEDGLFPTSCGAFALDNVSVMGGGISYFSDFETDDGGWVRLYEAGPGGDWSNLVHINDLPPPLDPCGCPLADSVLVFEDLFASGHGLYQDNMAFSPWIDLERYGFDGSPRMFIEADFYVNMPVLNYVFVTTGIQYYPDVCTSGGASVTSPIQRPGFVYYYGDTPVCTVLGPAKYGISFLIGPDVEEIRVGLGVVSWCRFNADCSGFSNSSPWFDNVRLGVFGDPSAPYLSVSSFDGVPVDNFPENGSLRVDAPGRFDGGTWSGAIEADHSLWDELEADVSAEGAEVRVQFAARPGPFTDPVAFANWESSHQFEETKLGLDWYSARMDTAEYRAGFPNAGSYMTRYHEEDPNFSGDDNELDPNDLDPQGEMRLGNDMFPDDLFTPGSTVLLFYKARFEGSTSWYIVPDTTGENYLEIEIFPTSMAADSTFNCVLYVDRGSDDSVVEPALANILTGGSPNFENTAWDRYDCLAPGSDISTFGRPLNTEFGASLTQALGYKAILWGAGSGSSFRMTKEDSDLLIPWLTLLEFPDNNLYMFGDNLVASMIRESAKKPSNRVLLEDLAGVLWSCNTFREVDCPTGTVADSTNCVGLDPVTGANVADPGRAGTQVGIGNGCPEIESFDVLSPNPTPQFGVATGDEKYVGDLKVAQFSAISNDAQASGPLTYRTVVDGLTVEHRRETGNCDPDAPTPPPVEARLREVLDWFGYSEGGVCSDPTAGVGLEPPQAPKPVTTLANFSPNPFMGDQTGIIRFTTSRETRATLSIFDVNGRLVKTVFDEVTRAGQHEATWDGSDRTGRPVASGVYFYRLHTPDKEFARKLIVVRR